MGRRDLPDMYAQAERCAASESKCGYIKQIPTTHVCNTFSNLKNLLNLTFTVLPLYLMMEVVYGYGILILMFL